MRARSQYRSGYAIDIAIRAAACSRARPRACARRSCAPNRRLPRQNRAPSVLAPQIAREKVDIRFEPAAAVDRFLGRRSWVAGIEDHVAVAAHERLIHAAFLTIHFSMAVTHAIVASRAPDARDVVRVDTFLRRLLQRLLGGFVQRGQRLGARDRLGAVAQRTVGVGAHHAVDLIFGERLVGLDGTAHSAIEPTVTQAALKRRERIIAAQLGLIVRHPLRLAVGQPDHTALAPAGLLADATDEIERDRTWVQAL